MANFFANRRVDYTGLDISGLRDADDSGFDNNVNVRVHGITYEDVVWFEDGLQAVGFGGRGITLSGDAVTGGTVTGVLTETWTGTAWAQDWLLEGISVSAVSLYRAALTDERDRALAGEIAIGTLRWQGAFDHIVTTFADRPLKKFDAEVLDVLRLTIFQILHLERIPVSAAVKDAVDLIHDFALTLRRAPAPSPRTAPLAGDGHWP